MGESERWDAIVIGSGLGGLTTAAYLCAAGKRTLVLEAHYVAGGNSQVFRRRIHGRQYEFDVGIHYLGECGRDGIITGILNGLGLAERVVFRPLDPDGYSTLIFPDFTFRVPVGWDRYRARLLETFPDEADALTKVLDVLRSVADDGRSLTLGEISTEELTERALSLGADPAALIAARPDPTFGPIAAESSPGAQRTLTDPNRCTVGQSVTTRGTPSTGHTRLPAYARGHRGTIVAKHGGWLLPDANAHGLGERPEHLYTVEFSGEELWGSGAEAGFRICIDLFESYLEAANE